MPERRHDFSEGLLGAALALSIGTGAVAQTMLRADPQVGDGGTGSFYQMHSPTLLASQADPIPWVRTTFADMALPVGCAQTTLTSVRRNPRN